MRVIIVEGVECVQWKDNGVFDRWKFISEMATEEQKAVGRVTDAPGVCTLCPLLPKSAAWERERGRPGKCGSLCEKGSKCSTAFIPAKYVPILRMRGVPDDAFE